MKRILSFVLSLVLVFSLIPSAFAANSDEFVSIDGILAEYNGSGGDVIIPDGYTSIGSTAFYWNPDIISVTIPDSVAIIHAIAFRDCINLTDVVIGNGVTDICALAFFNCSNLTDITLGQSVTTIDASAFEGCSKLSNVYYAGSKSDWEKISIGTGNEALLNATIHYSNTTSNTDENEPVSSEALTPQEAAQSLYELGLFNGTGTDANGNPIFDLDRAPTRHEAVTMLVRLLGKGEEAENGTWNTPFTDVADWAKPYVGYAYANGLTSGTSATTYSGDAPVTASQYLTFVLRALGYSSGTDFQWDRAWELSDSLGITNGQYNADTTAFTRGDVAIISYNALSAGKKPMDYSYLAASDFRTVRREYPHAVAICGYAYEYTDLNGEQCVLTVVQYKIIQQYSVITLHNLTQGTTITDPNEYYNDRIDRAYGQNKLNYYDQYEDFLTHYQTALQAMSSVLQGGKNTASGSFLNAEYLNQ